MTKREAEAFLQEARKCEANADEYRLIAKWLKEYEQITSKENSE